MYDLGDAAHLTIEVKDLDGGLADSTVTLNITLPDQTVAGPFTPTRDSIGLYHYDYTTTQAGRHAARWVGTNATFAHTDVFDVQPAADISIVSLSSVKTQLGIASATYDDELRDYLLSASENIEGTAGICAVRSFTDRATSTGAALWLPHPPVIALTGIAPVYTWLPQLSLSQLTVKPRTGKVTRLDRCRFLGEYDITYTAGRPVIPSSLQLACRIIVQHLWETRRGGTAASFAGSETVTLPGWGYAIPNRAAELIGPYGTGTLAA